MSQVTSRTLLSWRHGPRHDARPDRAPTADPQLRFPVSGPIGAQRTPRSVRGAQRTPGVPEACVALLLGAAGSVAGGRRYWSAAYSAAHVRPRPDGVRPRRRGAGPHRPRRRVALAVPRGAYGRRPPRRGGLQRRRGDASLRRWRPDATTWCGAARWWPGTRQGRPAAPARPFRVVGAHTDSPNLRIKPNPDVARAGWQLLGGRGLRRPPAQLLARPRPRAVGPRRRARGRRAGRDAAASPSTSPSCGWRSSPSTSTAARTRRCTSTRSSTSCRCGGWARARGLPGRGSPSRSTSTPSDVLAWDVMTHVAQPARRIGRDRDLIAAPRLDNLATCRAGVRGAAAAPSQEEGRTCPCSPSSTTRRSAACPSGAPARRLLPSHPRAHRPRGRRRARRLLARAGRHRRSPRATWPTRRIPTTPNGTTPSTRSTSTAVRCSRSTPSCATPPTPSGPRPSPSRASRRACPSSASSSRTDLPVRLHRRSGHGRPHRRHHGRLRGAHAVDAQCPRALWGPRPGDVCRGARRVPRPRPRRLTTRIPPARPAYRQRDRGRSSSIADRPGSAIDQDRRLRPSMDPGRVVRCGHGFDRPPPPLAL